MASLSRLETFRILYRMSPTPSRPFYSARWSQWIALAILFVVASTCTAESKPRIMTMDYNSSTPWANDTLLGSLRGKDARAAARYYVHRLGRKGTVQDCLEDTSAYICTGSCLKYEQLDNFPYGFIQIMGFRHDSLSEPHGCTVDGSIFTKPTEEDGTIGMQYLKFSAERGHTLRKGTRHTKLLLHTYSITCPFVSHKQAQEVSQRVESGQLSRETAPAVLWEVAKEGAFFRAPVYNVRVVNNEQATGVVLMVGPLFGNVSLKVYVDYYKTRWKVDKFYVYTTNAWNNPDPKWYKGMERSGSFTTFQLGTESTATYYHGQILAQNTALWDAKSTFKYMMCFDPDEFLDWNFPTPRGYSVDDTLLEILEKLEEGPKTYHIPWITYEIGDNMLSINERPSGPPPDGFRPLQYPFDTASMASMCHYQGKPIFMTASSYYSAIHHTYQVRKQQKIFTLAHFRQPIDSPWEHPEERKVVDNAFVTMFPSVISCRKVGRK